jgi:glutamate carboxypeptidase
VRPDEAPATLPLDPLRKAAEARFDAYLDDLRTLVNVDCGTYLPDGVNIVADHMQERFASAGWEVERIAHHPAQQERRLGDILVATMAVDTAGRSNGGRRVLLVGHMDTVFPEGTAAARPFRIDGTRAFGPGVSDMKGGLLAGFYAVSCLQDVGFGGAASITYVCNPDEEIGSPFSGATILDRARRADACFVLEGARENGDIVSARKGVTDLRVIVHGTAAHAGGEPERGRSATLQAAHTVLALHDLNGRWPGVTVNVGVVQGGTRPNVVAERCELQVDVRSPQGSTFEQVLAEVDRLAKDTMVPDVTAEVVRMAGFPPMEKTEATGRLADLATRIAEGLGFEVHDAATGGASDANSVAGMGVPTLDGLGPVGGSDHAPGEWIDLQSVVPRIALLAGLISSP